MQDYSIDMRLSGYGTFRPEVQRDSSGRVKQVNNLVNLQWITLIAYHHNSEEPAEEEDLNSGIKTQTTLPNLDTGTTIEPEAIQNVAAA